MAQAQAMLSAADCCPLRAGHSARSFIRLPTPFRPSSHRNLSLPCRCAAEPLKNQQADMQRRSLLLSIPAAALALQAPAFATDGFATFWGLARPPTSYGAYAGDNKDAAKYAFEYPAGWKVETVGKNEKGMQGIDSRVRNTRVKGQTAYLVTFGRAGEDNKSFKLGDVDQTLAGFAGADYDLQDALVESTDKKTTIREADGQQFYDYELSGPTNNYLATVTLKQGKVYAFFVKSPAKIFQSDEPMLRSIVQSFRTV